VQGKGDDITYDLRLRGNWKRSTPSFMGNRTQLRNIRISGALADMMGLFFSWVLWAGRQAELAPIRFAIAGLRLMLLYAFQNRR
jgi:hypothetical protein